MRPFTLCYGLMITALGSLALYTIAHADDIRTPFGDPKVFIHNTKSPGQPTVVLPSRYDEPVSIELSDGCLVDDADADEIVASNESVTVGTESVIRAGMSSDDALNVLGEPDSISANGARWIYGSTVLIFNDDDRLSGHVEFDPVQAALNKYNHMIASITSSEQRASTANSKPSGPKILTASVKTPTNHSKWHHKSVAAGSARTAYRYDRNRNEYSYYMNRHGPRDRTYTGKRFIPRGMSTTTERNLGMSYLQSGGSRYLTSPSTQYRR